MNRIKRYRIKLARKWQQVEIGEPPSRFGKGKFVDTIRLRGGRIKLVSHEANPSRPKGTLILTPYWENHGFLVKYIDENGKHRWTNNMDFGAIYRAAHGVEEAAPKDDILTALGGEG